MSLLDLDYRPRQPRTPIISLRSLRLFLLIVAVILVIVRAIYFFDRPGATAGTTQTTVISFVDVKTKAPIPITVSGPTYPAADPWKRKISVIPPNAVRIQWVDPKAPAPIYIASPGYQGLGISPGGPGSNYPPTMSIGLWPASPATTPPATTPPATQSSGSPNPTTAN